MKQFEGYEEYLKQSELSKQTRQVYLREAEKFVRYLNGKEITKDRTPESASMLRLIPVKIPIPEGFPHSHRWQLKSAVSR